MVRRARGFWAGLLVGVALAWAAATDLAQAVEADSAASRAPAATAAAPATGVPEALVDSVVAAARQNGASVILLAPPPDAGAAASAPAPATTLERLTRVRNALAVSFARLADAPTAIVAALRAQRADGSLAWIGWTAVLSLIAAGLGAAARLATLRWGRGYLRTLAEGGAGRVVRVGYVLARTALGWLSAAAFVGAGLVPVVALAPHDGPARATSLTVLFAIGLYLVLRDLFVNLFLPHAPRMRLLALDDRAAAEMSGELRGISAVGALVLGLTAWLAELGIDEPLADAFRVAGAVLSSVLLAAFAIGHRRRVAGLIRGTQARAPLLRRVLASLWHVLVVAYLAFATAVNVGHIVTSEGFRLGPILAPVVGFVAGFAVFGVSVILVDLRFRDRAGALGPTGAAVSADGPSPAMLEPVLVWQLRWKRLLEHLAAVASFIVGLVVVAVAWWGMDRGHVLAPDATETLLGLFAAYALYQAVRTWIDGKITDETPASGTPADGEEGMGQAASRLATLLPLVRSVLLVVVVAIVAMVALSGMGVALAPLFAGAGVIGLAVGFGAQTLIRDIFSGAFFLLDDAFRRGEYIDVGGITGAVEKISLRSFQLRHHNGPLHTIPFGEIKQLTNFSRDWVVMKLPLRLAYGTDVERVRKLVKKLGQELMQDPEIGRLFVEPLKSQGVVEMEDSAMILRVKFMTRPGDQFVARRHVFTRVHELFARENIKFAHRQVTVHIADDGTGPADRDAREKAAAGAVRSVLDAEAAGEAGAAASAR